MMPPLELVVARHAEDLAWLRRVPREFRITVYDKGDGSSGGIRLPNIGREAHIDLKAGALDGLSIGYRVKSDAYDGRRRARLLKDLDLLEVSLVSFPMNDAARVTADSICRLGVPANASGSS
jgi:HK97 family phage prohead protease